MFKMTLVPHRTPLQADPADGPAFRAAQHLCRPWGDLTFSSRLLDRSRRDAVCAVVAFFGMIADAFGRDAAELAGGQGLRQHPAVVSPAGGCCSSGGGEGLLVTFRQRLDAIYAGGLELPSPHARSPQQHALHALARTLQRFEVSRDHFLDFAEERVRAASISRYPTWARLAEHCRATGGSVAAAVGEVLGLQHSDAPAALARLGMGLRLVQILRDVPADAQRGRIYLPLADLANCRYSERELLAGAVNERREKLWRMQAERARSLLAEGSEAIRWIAGEKSKLFAATMVVQAEAMLSLAPGVDGLTTGMRLRRLPAAWRLARATQRS